MTRDELKIEKTKLYTEYLEAERKVLLNQSYTIKDRTYTRADLRALQQERRKLENELLMMDQGGSVRTIRAVPTDY